MCPGCSFAIICESQKTPAVSQSRNKSYLYTFIQEFLGLINLGGQVWASASIGVVGQHERAMLLANLVLVEGSFTVKRLINFLHEKHCV